MKKQNITRHGVMREYRKVQASLKTADANDRNALAGAQQALAWVLQDNAMAPSKCFGLRIRGS